MTTINVYKSATHLTAHFLLTKQPNGAYYA